MEAAFFDLDKTVIAKASMVAFGKRANETEVTLLRASGAPFERQGGKVIDQIRIKVGNRGSAPARYRIEFSKSSPVTLVAPENPLLVAPGAQRTTSVFAVALFVLSRLR